MGAATKLQVNPPSAKSDWDFEQFFLGCDGDPILARDLMRLFLDSVPKYRASLHKALADRDIKAVEFAAHRILGTVAIFHSSVCVALAAEMEGAAKGGRLAGLEPQLQNLGQGLDLLARDITAALEFGVAHE